MSNEDRLLTAAEIDEAYWGNANVHPRNPNEGTVRVAEAASAKTAAAMQVDWVDKYCGVVDERDALRAKGQALADALELAHVHVEELRDAWQRGVISEHDTIGMGGTRSNRNADVERGSRGALATWNA